MSSDYSLEIETDLTPQAFAEVVAGLLHLPVLGIERLRSGYLRILLEDTSVAVYPQEPLDVTDIRRTYGFEPQIGLLFGLHDDVPALDLDAVMVLSVKVQRHTGRNAVLLFNYETPVVLFRDGEVILNQHWRAWDISSLPSEIRERQPRVLPLAIKGL